MFETYEYGWINGLSTISTFTGKCHQVSDYAIIDIQNNSKLLDIVYAGLLRQCKPGVSPNWRDKTCAKVTRSWNRNEV